MWPINWYGILIGLGIGVAYFFVRKRIKEASPQRINELDDVLGWVVVGGVIGARVWHVMTDFGLYRQDVIRILSIWQGGLSIIGAIIAGFLTVIIYSRIKYPSDWRKTAVWWADVAVFGLPIAQAIGRVGNYLNQELYGPPTSLPWGIYIDEAKRLSSWQNYAHFHPLFAYEALPLVILTVIMWWQRRRWPIGSGKWLMVYVTFYAWLRVGLEFLRLDKALLIGSLIVGINQVVLIGVGCLGLIWLWSRVWYKVIPRFISLVVIGVWLAVCLAIPKFPTTSEPVVSPTQLHDRQQTQVRVGNSTLSVEVVNSPASITLGLSGRSSIGSDGMLFVMPGPPQIHSFWMKEMQFGLDIIWLDQGKIVDISAHVPPPSPGQPLATLPVYRPTQPASLVLEVPAGTAATQGWQAGTPFEWYH